MSALSRHAVPAEHRKAVALLVVVLFFALVQAVCDWALFAAGAIALRFVLGMGSDPGLFQTPVFPWAFQIIGVLGTPAAIYGGAIGWPEIFGRGASFPYALLTALMIGVASVMVFITLWPEHDPPEFPVRLIEAVKVMSFVISGLACWWVVRRAALGERLLTP